MNVPEWVRIISRGTLDELREFVLKTPRFDWDGTMFDGYTAFFYVWRRSAQFCLPALAILHNLGGATFESVCCGQYTTPLRIAAIQGDTQLAESLLGYGVKVTSLELLYESPTVCKTIAEYSTTLTKDVVDKALIATKRMAYSDGSNLHNPYWASAHKALESWLVSHDHRRDASICIAWTLSQLTGTAWPDMIEGVARRLMETRVREW
jgi:hypothetical protein